MTNNLLGFSDFLVWVIALSFVSCQFFKKSIPLALTFFWVSFSGLLVFQNSLNLLPAETVIRLYDMSAESALFSLFLTVGAVCCLSLETWKTFFKAIAVLNAALLCFDLLTETHNIPWGILQNGSMSGCFAACLFPLFDHNNEKEIGFKAFVGLSALMALRSLPVAVLFLMLGSDFFLLRQKGLDYFTINPGECDDRGLRSKENFLFQDEGRIEIWQQAFYYFRHHVSFIPGHRTWWFLSDWFQSFK